MDGLACPDIVRFIEALESKEVSFKFRGLDFSFVLSHGLFSSAGVDRGSRFLLKVFSSYLDELLRQGDGGTGRAGTPLPRLLLDAGCGTGVLGICAAAAVLAAGQADIRVRAQDRDELARVFTEYNARRNGIPEGTLVSYTEPLLAGPGSWDIILSNIPAKAGEPVLEDFIRRSALLLNPGGLVFLVAVNPLAGFFRSRLGPALLEEANGNEHTVFVYRRFQAGDTGEKEGAACSAPLVFDENFPARYPFYVRKQGEYSIEETAYSLDTVYGAPDFDEPGGTVLAVAKLAARLDLHTKLGAGAFLVYEPDQGHFACWLAAHLGVSGKTRWVFSGRNILSLGAARRNLGRLLTSGIFPVLAPSADLFLDRQRLFLEGGGEGFAFIAAFPETVPPGDRREAHWEALAFLAAPGATVITGFSSFEAERFDRLKHPAFSRRRDIKRKGFRALAYQKKG